MLDTFSAVEKDVEAVGAQCHLTSCHQLDFLPFRCESCKQTFCLEHRTEHAHQCPKAGAWAAARRERIPSTKPTPATAQQCSYMTCKTLINTLTSVGVTCADCRRQYCLKHRLSEDHDCQPAVSKPAAQTEKARSAFNRLRMWSKEKAAIKSSTSSRAAQTVALNKLKHAAKGDDKVPVERRIYLHVEAEAASTSSKLPSAEVFYSKEWSIGRVLDASAKQLQIANTNNIVEGEADRLRIFHVEGGRLLDYAEKLGVVCVSGNTLVLLRGMGKSEPP